jgi:NTE family protein
MENKYDTLVLSGNSTNALSTLGALQKLFEARILIKEDLTSFYGTSSGSMICSLLALGFDPIEILAQICVNKSYSKVSGFSFANLASGGVMNFDAIEREFEGLIVAKLGYVPTIGCVRERFGKTLVFVTYNMTIGRKEFLTPETFPDLLITKAVRMSASFPFVFSPFEYYGNFYIDGGIVENFPMMTAQMTGKKCFGMFNNNSVKPYTPQMSYFELFFRLLTVFISSSSENIPELPGSKILKLSYEPSFFNFMSSNSDLIKMFDNGYEVASCSVLKNQEGCH